MSDRYRWDEVPQGQDFQGGGTKLRGMSCSTSLAMREAWYAIFKDAAPKGSTYSASDLASMAEEALVETTQEELGRMLLLAQLGARVLEILRDARALDDDMTPVETFRAGAVVSFIAARDAARSLCLLESEAKP